MPFVGPLTISLGQNEGATKEAKKGVLTSPTPE